MFIGLRIDAPIIYDNRMRYERWLGICALGVALLSKAAGGGASLPQIDACSLLLPAEISTAIGLPVENGTRKDDGLVRDGSYSSTCVWKVIPARLHPDDPTAPLGGSSFVILNAMQWPPGSGLAKKFLEAFRKAAVDGDIPHTPLPRTFGDEALWWGDGLAVRQGDVSFGISVFIPGSSPKLAEEFEERLAPQILRRLEERELRTRGS